ncbi:hypothetical protein BGZ91_007679 [Linnemannia elongata]|nr:hypothetical protein BGZ91_007679 [Linnemannia elongata]
MKWFLIAVIQGNANAQNHIGCLYYSGGGVPQDFSKAYEWYLKAAEQNNRHAQDKLGGLYHHGKGVVQDFSNAMECVGYMYLYGYGMPVDYSQASV